MYLELNSILLDKQYIIIILYDNHVLQLMIYFHPCSSQTRKWNIIFIICNQCSGTVMWTATRFKDHFMGIYYVLYTLFYHILWSNHVSFVLLFFLVVGKKLPKSIFSVISFRTISGLNSVNILNAYSDTYFNRCQMLQEHLNLIHFRYSF